MIKEFDRVALTTDLPEFHLQAGDVGTVVDITPNRKQYTLEFINFDGDTIAVVPVEAAAIRAIGSREITHTQILDEAS